MPRKIIICIAMIGSISLFCWQATQGAKPKDEMLELYGLFVDAVEKVETNYVRPVKRRELLESALRGCFRTSTRTRRSSTPVSGSSSEADRREVRRDRHPGRMDAETDRLKVIAPMVGTPAYEAGVLAGDLIMEIDGQSTEGMSPDKAVEVLTGRPGTAVKLDVCTKVGRPETITITRAIIDVPSVLGDRASPTTVGLHARQGQEDRLRPDHRASSRTRPTS